MSIRHDEAQHNVRDLLANFEARGYQTRLDDSYPNELTGEVELDGDKVLAFTAEPMGDLACSVMQTTPDSKHGSYVAGLETYFNLGEDANDVCEKLIGEVGSKGYNLQMQPEPTHQRPDLASGDAAQINENELPDSGSTDLGI